MTDKEIISLLGAVRVCRNLIKVVEWLILDIEKGNLGNVHKKDIYKLKDMLFDAKEQLRLYDEQIDKILKKKSPSD